MVLIQPNRSVYQHNNSLHLTPSQGPLQRKSNQDSENKAVSTEHQVFDSGPNPRDQVKYRDLVLVCLGTRSLVLFSSLPSVSLDD